MLMKSRREALSLMRIIANIAGGFINPEEIKRISTSIFIIEPSLKYKADVIREVFGSTSILQTIHSILNHIENKKNKLYLTDERSTVEKSISNSINYFSTQIDKTLVTQASFAKKIIRIKRSDEKLDTSPAVISISPNWMRSVHENDICGASDPYRWYVITHARKIHSHALTEMKLTGFEVDVLYFYKKKFRREHGYVIRPSSVSDVDPAFGKNFDICLKRAKERLFALIQKKMEG